MKIDKRDFPIHSGDFPVDYGKTKLNNAIDNTMYLSKTIIDIVEKSDANFLKLRNEINDIKRSVIYKHNGFSFSFLYSF